MKSLSPTTLWFMRGLLGLSATALVVALLAPVMIIHPGFGVYTEWVTLINADLSAPQPISIATSILEVIRVDVFLGLLLAVASWFFPLAKTLIAWVGLEAVNQGKRPNGLLRWTKEVGLFSMTELLILAIFALTLKELPGGTNVEFGWAVVPFLISFFLTLGATRWVSKKAETL